MLKTLTERIATNCFAGVRPGDIDEDLGVIRNVCICGEISANGRRYPTAMMRRDFRRYEGAVVNYDHSSAAGARLFQDRAGWLSNVRLGSDGRPRGDLHIAKSDPRSAKVFELARRNPRAFGLSHVANCRTRMESGVEIVEEIVSVESVDVVVNPATNSSLFESRHFQPRKSKTGPLTANEWSPRSTVLGSGWMVKASRANVERSLANGWTI